MFSPSKIGTKESGTVDGVYNYDFYYFPLGPELLEEVATRVAARRQKNEPRKACLGITKSVVKTYNIGPIVHMYGFIWDPAFPKDEASGAIQIGYDGVYITDLCRNFTENRTGGPSPVKVLMGKFDDIVKNELGQSKLRLMVLIKENDQPKEGSDKLIEIYQRYGFEPKHVESYKKGKEEQLIMEKRFADKDMSIMGSIGKPTKTKSVKKAERTSYTVTKTGSTQRFGGRRTRRRQ
jgi:hypothetical protein